MNYTEYLQKHINVYAEVKDLSSSLQDYLKHAYENYNINVAPFFNLNNDNTEKQVFEKVNELIRKQFKIKFHNIGKNPYKRYFKLFGGFEWLKLETYLISHFYAIGKSESYISNRKIAIALGYLDEREIDKETIVKACRKVTDSLAILKNDRKTISVEQRFNANQRGSYHVIKAHWHVIIELYSKYDYKASGSIRFRKSIRYRIISLMKNIRRFGEALNNLLRKQKNKYLKGLIEYTESEDFQENKFAVFKLLKDFKWMTLSSDDFNTNNIVPSYDHPNLVLEVKNERVYHELMYKNYVTDTFKRQYKINTTIKPMF